MNPACKALLRAVAFGAAAFAGLQASAQDFQFASIEKLIEQDVGRVIMPKVYEKAGYSISITPMPGQRAQQEATTGAKDGEIMRIFTYGEENPTTIRVPTPYYYLETMGFIREDSGIVINSKEDLANYRLVKVRGVKHTNNITRGMPDVHDIKNTNNMMEFLRRGRADIALTNTVDGVLALRNLGYNDIVPLSAPLATLDLFNYIHEKNSDLVPEIDAVIQEMQASGEMDQIISAAEEEVIAARSN